MRDFEKTLTERTKNAFNILFFKEINEKNVEKLFDVEKNNLFYNIVIQQLRRNDVRKTCNSKRQMKSLFKFLMIKFKKFQKKLFVNIRMKNQLKLQNQRDAYATRE